MAVILQANLNPGTAAWAENQDVVAGSVDTDATTAAGAASQAAIVETGNAADGATGALTVASGTATSATGTRVSGAVTVRSGTSTSAAATGGVTGALTIGSGDSDTGAQPGGDTGNVVIQSGDAASTGAGVSGATGSVTVESGASVSGLSGNVVLLPGASSTPANRGHTQATGLRTLSAQATAITAARIMSLADSGGVFSVSQGAAYAITLPVVGAANTGVRYTFFLIAPDTNNVTIAPASGATLVGSIVLDASVIVATGTTLTFASGASLLGDNIEVFSTGVNWMVRAVSSAAAGISVA